MDDPIKLPSSSYEQLCRIIMGYAQINKPASLSDISKRTGIGPTVVSGNNGFLLNIGVIEGGNNKSATAIGKKLGDALSHDLEHEAALIYQDLIENNEFLKNLVGAIRIRKGMDEAALKAHVGYSAGAPKSSAVITGTGTVVEILKRSGTIEERDGKLVAASSAGISSPSAIIPVTPVTIEAPGVIEVVTKRHFSASTGVSGAAVSISIEVQVACKPSELDGLGQKLRAVLDELEKPREDLPGADD